ncbi:MAG TPA: P-II family nitrogen regulator [Clostridia bacterium]|nr:P-II family nitrogen regulator [Clostridia bacterium]
MKKIEAIIRPNKLEDVKEALQKIDINGLTMSQVLGCGKQKGWKEYYRGSEVNMNVLPKIKLELVVDDSKLEKTLDTIIEHARTGEVGDGKIFVSEITDCIRIRTGEHGENAI